MKSVNVRQLESKLTWPNVTAAVGAKSAVESKALGIQASQFTGVLDQERQATRWVSHSQEETGSFAGDGSKCCRPC